MEPVRCLHVASAEDAEPASPHDAAGLSLKRCLLTVRMHPPRSHDWTAALVWRVPELDIDSTILLRWDETGVLQDAHVPELPEHGWPVQATNLLQANGIRVPPRVARRP